MKTQSYAELLGQSFNWREFLTKAQFGLGVYEGRTRAASWCTCAVGNQSALLERLHSQSPHGAAPIDQEIRILGFRFLTVLTQMHETDYLESFEYYRNEALKILERIEARAEAIIKEKYGDYNSEKHPLAG